MKHLVYGIELGLLDVALSGCAGPTGDNSLPVATEDAIAENGKHRGRIGANGLKVLLETHRSAPELNTRLASTRLPRQVWGLLALYCLASALHFAHNAEYIAFYPNMPSWVTREKVYAVWFAITGIGALGALFAAAGWRMAAAFLMAMYGALGLDGLGHYALALCSQHTLFSNFTIWFEVSAGGALAASASWHAWLWPR